MHSKPLYLAEKQIQYHKHLERLKKIANKRNSLSAGHRIMEEGFRFRSQSLDYQSRERSYQIKTENNKILEKLLEISERSSVPAYSTIAPHTISKKQSNIISYNNPERKRRQQEILESNNKLAQRLLTKESEFDRNKTIKNIEQYENVRKTLQNNRRIKLIPLQNESGGYDFSCISNTFNIAAETKAATLDISMRELLESESSK